MPKNKNLVTSAKICAGSIGLTLILIVLYLLIPVAISLITGISLSEASEGEPSSTISGLIAIGVFVLLIFSAIIFSICALLILIEIVTANKNIKWKIFWILVCGIFGIFGIFAYLFWGRKGESWDPSENT